MQPQPVDDPRNELPRLLDIESVAARLGVTVRDLRRLVAERRIPFIKVGHFIRLNVDELNEWFGLVAARRRRPRLMRSQASRTSAEQRNSEPVSGVPLHRRGHMRNPEVREELTMPDALAACWRMALPSPSGHRGPDAEAADCLAPGDGGPVALERKPHG